LTLPQEKKGPSRGNPPEIDRNDVREGTSAWGKESKDLLFTRKSTQGEREAAKSGDLRTSIFEGEDDSPAKSTSKKRQDLVQKKARAMKGEAKGGKNRIRLFPGPEKRKKVYGRRTPRTKRGAALAP